MQDPLLKLLSECSGAFRARLAAHVEKNVPDLTRFQIYLLTVIGRKAGTSQQDLARIMGRDKAQIARTVKILEARGLILRQASAEDGRSQRVRLSDPGTEIIKDTENYRDSLAACAFQDLSSKDRIVLENALRAMLKRIKSSEDASPEK